MLDAIEAAADRLEGVRVHQMHALRDRPYLAGVVRRPAAPRLVLPVVRSRGPAFAAGTIDLVPNNFSEMRRILRDVTNDPTRAGGGVAAGSSRLLLASG